MTGALAAVLKSSLEAGLILVLFCIGLTKAGFNKQKTAVFFGLIAASLAASIIVYGLDFFGDREIFEGNLSFVISLTLLGYWFWTLRRLRLSGIIRAVHQQDRGILCTVIMTLTTGIALLGKIIEIVAFPSTVFLMSANILNTEAVLKISGALLALAVTAFFVFLFLKLENRIGLREFVFFGSAVVLVVVSRQVITGLQVLFATGVLPLTTWAVDIIAPLINSYYPMFFYTLIGLTVALWSLVGRRVKKDSPHTSAMTNPAQKRKLRAAFIIEKRWVKVFGLCLFTVISILGGDMAAANHGAKMEPPTPVTAQGGRILVPLEQVNDGKLHRFSYMSADNLEIRFVVIKKGENLFGTGLDACDICGQAGYYQKGREVICKNCGVAINIPTIGFPGGCNPIPLKNQRDGANIVISSADLEAKKEVFRE